MFHVGEMVDNGLQPSFIKLARIADTFRGISKDWVIMIVSSAFL